MLKGIRRLSTFKPIADSSAVPTNVKDRDEFHITIEEYLIALTSLVEELVCSFPRTSSTSLLMPMKTRLARNAVTLGDYERPLLINQFVKDVFAGFQILNLKNDILRRKSDGLKYRVKDVEDVVYDLSLRNLVPKRSVKEEDIKAEQ